MTCPKCGRILRVNRSEKKIAERDGVVMKLCSTCSNRVEIPYDMLYDRKGYHKELREKRKEQGLCADCGARPHLPGLLVCDKCNEKKRRWREQTRSLQNDYAVKETKRKKAMTMDEIVIAAAKEGITYGQYVAKYGV